MQVALYRAHGHFQDLRNFRRVEIFLIAQDHDGAGFLRQLPDQLAQPFAEQGVGLTGIARRFRDAVEPDLRAQIPLAYLIDRSMADGAAQPAGGVSRAFNAASVAWACPSWKNPKPALNTNRNATAEASPYSPSANCSMTAASSIQGTGAHSFFRARVIGCWTTS